MDSGGILCLHYSFCCRVALGAGMVYAADVYPRGPAGWGGAGDGIYGADAVAEYHFNTTAYKLTKGQCALIAASLPNPRRFNSAKPSGYMLKRQSRILREMKFVKPL